MLKYVYKIYENRIMEFDFIHIEDTNLYFLNINLYVTDTAALKKYCKAGKYLYGADNSEQTEIFRKNELLPYRIIKFKFKTSKKAFLEVTSIGELEMIRLYMQNSFENSWLCENYLAVFVSIFGMNNTLYKLSRLLGELEFKLDLMGVYYYKRDNISIHYSHETKYVSVIKQNKEYLLGISKAHYFHIFIEEDFDKIIDSMNDKLIYSVDLLDNLFQIVATNKTKIRLCVDNKQVFSVVLTPLLIRRLLDTSTILVLNAESINVIEKECAKVILLRKYNSMSVYLYVDYTYSVYKYAIQTKTENGFEVLVEENL